MNWMVKLARGRARGRGISRKFRLCRHCCNSVFPAFSRIIYPKNFSNICILREYVITVPPAKSSWIHVHRAKNEKKTYWTAQQKALHMPSQPHSVTHLPLQFFFILLWCCRRKTYINTPYIFKIENTKPNHKIMVTYNIQP